MVPGGTATAAAGPVVAPTSWQEALEARAERPELTPICGGTDLMVELNFFRRRPDGLLDLTRVDELATWTLDGSVVELGAGVTYRRIEAELAGLLPALAKAARTVGSPQIRNRGTVGGNLGTASPAGDAHPALLATGATVEVASVRGVRSIWIDDFFVGPKRNALEPDELIRSVRIPVAAGPQEFAKVGPRNAMVIATVSFALAVDRRSGRVGTGIGSAGPTPHRAADAERFLDEALTAPWGTERLPDEVAHEFGRRVAAAASPIDDVRGTADYRRHALGVLARRCLQWAWSAPEEPAR